MQIIRIKFYINIFIGDKRPVTRILVLLYQIIDWQLRSKFIPLGIHILR